MKTFNYYLGSVSIILGLLLLVLLRDMNIFYTHITEIVSALSSLMFFTILFIVFGADERCLTIKEFTGFKTRKDFFTVPILCIVYILEIAILYLVNPIFAKEHFSMLTGAIGSIVFAFVIYAMFGGTYMIIRTSTIKEKQPKKSKD